MKFEKHKYLTLGPNQTKKLGENLAKKIAKMSSEKTIVLGLEGDLGGGKTTFLQGFAKGLGIKEKILSPTFVIMKKFKIPSPIRARYLIHIDCYRVKKPKEILNLGFKEIVSYPKNIVTIEWAEKIKKILPKKTILVKFKFVDKNKREILIADK
jgi:tRNA threonylcarbamoyladenosine biosynthesis protein TsaE